jgi:2'-5' RNA ligase
MKAAIVLIASNEGENFGRKMMLRAHRAGGMGFEMARLPQHVSLKQTFIIPSLERVEAFFDEFVKKMKPMKIEFEQIDVFPNTSLGGVPSGVMSLRVKETPELKNAQMLLFDELYKEFGPCPSEHDDDYIFHMTVAIGGAPFENYQKAWDSLTSDEEIIKELKEQSYVFDKLGLFYYDDDNIVPGTYFNYKVVDI